MPFASIGNHRLLRDLCNENDKHKPFGGKTILLCGDFQQILPVIPHESHGTLIENCKKYVKNKERERHLPSF